MINLTRNRILLAGSAALVFVCLALVPLEGCLEAQAPPPGGAQTAAAVPPPAWPPVRDSWLTDRRALGVGQIITILIDEQTEASADREVSATRDRSRDLSIGVGASGSMSGGGLRSNNDVTNRERGESTRRERFAAEISARVVAVGPDGLLRIEGAKKVKIDKHEQVVTVRGWIRGSDVSIQNTIQSWRIADAEILYDSNGELGKAGGFWSKLFDLIIP